MTMELASRNGTDKKSHNKLSDILNNEKKIVTDKKNKITCCRVE